MPDTEEQTQQREAARVAAEKEAGSAPSPPSALKRRNTPSPATLPSIVPRRKMEGVMAGGKEEEGRVVEQEEAAARAVGAKVEGTVEGSGVGGSRRRTRRRQHKGGKKSKKNKKRQHKGGKKSKKRSKRRH